MAKKLKFNNTKWILFAALGAVTYIRHDQFDEVGEVITTYTNEAGQPEQPDVNKLRLSFTDVAAQGELLFRRIKGIPAGYKKATAEDDGRYILAHSETGHHHVLLEDPAIEYYVADEDQPPEAKLRAYLVVNEIIDKQLTHMRDFDTHMPVVFPIGTFELISGRESEGPEGWRRAVD